MTGQGLGPRADGRTVPIKAQQKFNNAGVGTKTNKLGPVKPGDDEFTKYRKLMALSYRYRPNPLVIVYIHMLPL